VENMGIKGEGMEMDHMVRKGIRNGSETYGKKRKNGSGKYRKKGENEWNRKIWEKGEEECKWKIWEGRGEEVEVENMGRRE